MEHLEVAKWLLEKIERENYVYQEDVVYKIQENFGKEFVYSNENGNLAISKGVLKQFRKISEHSVVWVKGERCWRKREGYDSLGRQVD